MDIAQACFKYFSGPFDAVIRERDQIRTIRVPLRNASDIGKKLLCTSDGMVKLISFPDEEQRSSQQPSNTTTSSTTSVHVQSPDSQSAARSRKTLAGQGHKPEQVNGQDHQYDGRVTGRTRPAPSVRRPRCNPCSRLSLLASTVIFILFSIAVLLHCGGPDLPEALWIAGKHRFRNTQLHDAICRIPQAQLQSFFDCNPEDPIVLDHLDESPLRMSHVEHRKICLTIAPDVLYDQAKAMVNGIQKARDHKKKAFELLAYNRKLRRDILPNL